MTTGSASTSPRQYLTFTVAGADYAVSVLRVREVVAYVPVTRVPDASPVVRGVVNLRGSMVPVLDLGVRFGGGALGVSKLSCIVLVEVPREGEVACVGLLVDAVRAVVEVAGEAVLPVPAFGAPASGEALLGVIAQGDAFLHVLDHERVVAIAREAR